MRIGATDLLAGYKGSRLKVAEALIRGELRPYQEEFVGDIVDMVILEAAKFRIKEGLSKKE